MHQAHRWDVFDANPFYSLNTRKSAYAKNEIESKYNWQSWPGRSVRMPKYAAMQRANAPS